MLNLSHISFRVDNLYNAATEFQDMGFSIDWGGVKGKENNFFIWLGKGAFLEVFSIKKRFLPLVLVIRILYGKKVTERWWKWFTAKNELIDFALEDFDEKKTIIKKNREKIIVDIELVKESLQKNNIDFSKTMHWSRTNKNKDRVNYSFFVPNNKNLPFIVSRFEPSQKPIEIKHSNGSKSIGSLKIISKKSDYNNLQKLLSNIDGIILEKGEETRIDEIGIIGLNKEKKFCGVKLNPMEMSKYET